MRIALAISASWLVSVSASVLAQEEGELADPRGVESAVAPHLNLGHEDHGAGSTFGTWGSVGFFSGNLGNDAATVATFDLGMRIGLGTDAALTVDWGLALAATRVRGEYVTVMSNTPYDVQTERVEARNADFTFEYAPQLSTTLRLSVGLGVAVPVAAGAQSPATNANTAAQLEASRLAQDVYLATNGGWYAWRYRPERAAVFLPLGVAVRLTPQTHLAVEGAVALSIPILGGTENALSGDAMLAADVGHDVLSELRIGARVSVAALNLGLVSSSVQPTVEPWIRYRITDVSLLLRGTLPIAGRYGLGSDFPGWGVHLGASVDVQ